ncbi:hypothetical protein IQ06DRAFT_210393 [Phaeosphaeriaceae sp. SRC1lsM3a]|nr:hypothetical protein IQ06DRAFT_210393 [Stagonospora sp. SRC1lsM3a]
MARTSASGLPMIKCSSCGVDIDILQLADHVCAPKAPTATKAPAITPPDSPKLSRGASLGSFSKRSEGQAPSSRMRPPPRIDSNAANKPFRPLEPTPISNTSDSRSRSPFLSPTPPKSPFIMNRSATTPVPRRKLAPPSPDLTSNLDCAFPPFPQKRSATPQSAKPQQHERIERSPKQLYAEPSPLFAPLSPRLDGGNNVARRMNSIAPGPFDGRSDRRPSTASTSNPSPSAPMDGPQGHRRTGTQGSIRSVASAVRQRTSVSSTTSRASAYSNRSVGLPARPKMGADATSMPPPPLPTQPNSNEGIDAFLDRLQKESMGATQSREPIAAQGDLKREGSRERKQPPPRPRRPSESQLPSNDMSTLQPSAFAPRPTNTLPPRNASLGDSALSRPFQPPSSLPPSFLNDAPMNPLHTPSDSGLSDDSYASSGFRSAASSRSSPPGSVAGHSREASKLSRSEYLAGTPERTASPDSYSDSPKTHMLQNQSQGSQTQSKMNSPEAILQPSSPAYAYAPESPMDPAIQLGTAFDRRPRPSAPRSDLPSRLGQSPLRQPPQAVPRRQNSRAPSKGNCRGCSEPIVGKSVKDSSGRLTGRYHKQCFVCKTCSDPFPTAEFYVFENSPYCEHHYHELNGSLCASCNRGIEGQYLETDARTKYHPRCFTCTTCRIVLRDDYYEFNGQKYCERHARSAATPPQNFLGPGGYQPRMEKRRTRLMMMA